MQTEFGLFRQYRHNKDEEEGDRGGEFRVVKEGGSMPPPPGGISQISYLYFVILLNCKRIICFCLFLER